MNDFVESIKGKKVLIFGVGRQGGGAGDADFLSRHGAIVRLSDPNTDLAPEGQTTEQVDWAELIIKNPAVPDDHPLLMRAKEKGIEVATSIALFVQHTTVPVIGVTGTRGKSTTTALITHLLEQLYPQQIITGGNIPGTSGLSLLDIEQNKKYAVLELSSFQLHDFHTRRLSPPFAVITNLYPDHLNRYPSLASYQQAKTAICRYQSATAHCIYNEESEGAVAIAQSSVGVKHPYRGSDVADWDSPLPGLHNRENIAAMWALAQVLGIGEVDARYAVASFTGLPYRQQVVAKVKGVTYINDTTATTPTAAIKAILAQKNSTILICGGASKNLPLDELLSAIHTSPQIVGVIILGSLALTEFTQPLRERSSDKILGNVMSMTDAVKLAATHATAGTTVLLSPGFASFDLFQNEFDRGRQFDAAVNAL